MDGPALGGKGSTGMGGQAWRAPVITEVGGEAGRGAVGGACQDKSVYRAETTCGLNVIRKEAWLFCRTSSGVRLCWELEKPKGPKGVCRVHFDFELTCWNFGTGLPHPQENAPPQDPTVSLRLGS